MNNDADIKRELEKFDLASNEVEKQDKTLPLKSLLNFNKEVIDNCNSYLGGKIKVIINENPIYPTKKSVSNTISIFSGNSCLSSGAIFSSFLNGDDNVSTSIVCDGPAGEDGHMYEVNCLQKGDLTNLTKDIQSAGKNAAIGVIKQATRIMQQKMH